MTPVARTVREKASPLPFPVNVPFVHSLGIELHDYRPGHAELRVDLDAAHLNAWGVAHGGVVMTMLDVAMALVARSVTAHAGGVATIEMKSSFLRPAEHRLRAVGKVLHHTRSLVFCEASLFDDTGHLCASATGTFKALRGLPKRADGAIAPADAASTPPANLSPSSHHPVSPPPTKDPAP